MIKYGNGESVAQISDETDISRNTIYKWIKDNEINANQSNITANEFRKLKQKNEKLLSIIGVIQRVDCNVNSPLQVKLCEMEKLYSEYSVHTLCDAMKVPRGTFYNHILRNKRNNSWYGKRREELRIVIQDVYDEYNQVLGANKITAVLKERGYKISAKTVREIMSDLGLIIIREKAKELYDKEQKKYKNRINQDFDTTAPNQVWVSDVTNFRYNAKNYYICVIIDLYARKVVGYRVGLKNSTQLIKSTFKQAFESRQPEPNLIFHSDRGSNYRSNTFCNYLKEFKVKQSFSKAYVPYDNSVMESFFSTMKREELYRRKYHSEKELRTAIDEYIIFYNDKRPHYKNHYKTPSAKEDNYYNSLNK